MQPNDLPKEFNYRNITVGVLLIVLSLYPLYLAWYLTNFASFFHFLVDIACILVYNKLSKTGYKLIRGFKVYYV